MESENSPRVVVYDSDYQFVHEFLEEWKPSLVTSTHVEWLTVSNLHASKNDEFVDTPGLEAAWEALCLSSLDQLTTKDIERLAIAHNVLHGKWMAFVNSDEVDKMWATVAVVVVKGDLIHDAKVSTAHVELKKNGKPKEEKIPLGKHVICVWSPNFTDIEDVFALRGRLRDLGFSAQLFTNRMHIRFVECTRGTGLVFPRLNSVLDEIDCSGTSQHYSLGNMIYDVNSGLFRSFLSQKGGAADKRIYKIPFSCLHYLPLLLTQVVRLFVVLEILYAGSHLRVLKTTAPTVTLPSV